MKKISVTALLAFVFIFTLMSYIQAQSTQETLNQYISALYDNPNDYTLREKIIKLVQTMKPAPAIPEGAKKYIARGKAAFKDAKKVRDFNDAADEFQKAVLAAPWLAEGYYNLGIVQDKAGQYAAAIENLKLYVLAAPNAPDVEKVKEMIYEIEYRQEKEYTAKKAEEQKRIEEQRRIEEWKSQGVIDDPDAGLQWFCAPNQGEITWYQADTIAKNLSVAGGGWRLPTKAELKSLYDRFNYGNGLDKFSVKGGWVWSSESRGPSSVWCFSFITFVEYTNPPVPSYYGYGVRVLAVRSRR